MFSVQGIETNSVYYLHPVPSVIFLNVFKMDFGSGKGYFLLKGYEVLMRVTKTIFLRVSSTLFCIAVSSEYA